LHEGGIGEEKSPKKKKKEAPKLSEGDVSVTQKKNWGFKNKSPGGSNASHGIYEEKGGGPGKELHPVKTGLKKNSRQKVKKIAPRGQGGVTKFLLGKEQLQTLILSPNKIMKPSRFSI